MALWPFTRWLSWKGRLTIRTILRFWENQDSTNANKVFSRTLGKISFVSNDYEGDLPCAEEFWICDVIEELHAGQIKGCLLVRPTQKIAYSDLLPLSPLHCTLHVHRFCKGEPSSGITLVVKPVLLTSPQGTMLPWFLPLKYKKQLKTKEVVAVVVHLGGPLWTLK